MIWWNLRDVTQRLVIEAATMQAIWRFVTDNQQVLGWLGSGAVAVAGGIWTVVKFFFPRPSPPEILRENPKPNAAEKPTHPAAIRIAEAGRLVLEGRYEQARTAYDEANTLYTQERNRLGEANVLLGLGDLECVLNRYEQARTAYDKASTLYKQERNPVGEANVLLGLGDLERLLGRNEQARRAFENARTLYEQSGNRLGKAIVLSGLGDVERELGRNEQARRAYDEAIFLYKQLGN